MNPKTIALLLAAVLLAAALSGCRMRAPAAPAAEPAAPASDGEAGYGAEAVYGGASAETVDMDDYVYADQDPISTGVSGDYEYDVFPDETAHITRYTGTETNELRLPDTLDGYPVTGIGGVSFLNITCRAAVVPEGVRVLRNMAFASSSFEQVTLPHSLRSIGASAFTNANLTSLDIPEGVIRIKEYAFCPCERLVSVRLPETLRVIGNNAFTSCKSLTDITIPSSVTFISAGLFASCENLRFVALPAGITDIEEYAFYNCSALSHIEIPASVIEIGEEAFAGCVALTAVTIPDGVAYIGEEAFAGIDGLDIRLPASLTEIGESIVNDTCRIHCPAGSAAEAYAREWGIPYVIE